MRVLRRLPWDGLTSLCLHRAGATSQLGNGEAGGLHGGASFGVPEFVDRGGGMEQYGSVIGEAALGRTDQPVLSRRKGGAASWSRRQEGKTLSIYMLRPRYFYSMFPVTPPLPSPQK